ncbi:MAG: pirin family protein [Anaerovoracaceae bacterium]
MNKIREIKKIVTGRQAVDGAGVELVRVFGYHDTPDFDPFLMLDAFDATDPNKYIKGFPWHPHRGIETVTYLIKGDIEHGDSLGNKGSILDGDCQWMTAGSGIIHQEMPQAAERMLGAQLWINLPAKDKMTTPAYGDIESANVPVIDEDGVRVRIIAGKYLEHSGAFTGQYVDATYLDVDIAPGASWTFTNDPGHTLFIYIFTGDAVLHPEATFSETADALHGEHKEAGRKAIREKHAVLMGGGEEFYVRAGENGIRFILVTGEPLGEPIAWGGPIAMNTKQELDLAFEELKTDQFIK